MIRDRNDRHVAMIVSLLLAALFVFPGSTTAQDRSPSTYRIGPSDLLDILVKGTDDVGGQLTVSSAGTIAIPLLGELDVAGLTAEALAADLEERLATYMKDPEVDVFVLEFKRFKFSIMGAISSPGIYDMTDSLTLLEGLAMAGGVEFDDAKGSINILRGGEEGPISVDLEGLFQVQSDAFSFELLPGDVIHVVELRTFDVFVRGQVKSPGSFAVKEGTTLLKAITLAGGFEERAAKDRVRVVRVLENGEQEVKQYNLEKIAEGKEPDVVLLPGDVVNVLQTFF